MEIGERDGARAAGAADLHYGFDGRERDAEIARVHRDALRAGAENGVHAVVAGDRGTAAAGMALVAFLEGGIVKIFATRALHEISAHGVHVAKLRRCAGKQRLAHHRVTLAHQRVLGGVAVANHRADPHTARVLFDCREREAMDIDQHSRRFRAHAHEVDQIRATAEIFRPGLGNRDQRVGNAGGPRVLEGPHTPSRRATSRTAATMPSYAPQRQMLPLMRSRISASVSAAWPRLTSASRPTADTLWPGG